MTQPVRSGGYGPHAAFVAPARSNLRLDTVVVALIAIEFLHTLLIGALGWTLHLIPTATGTFGDSFYFGDTPAGMLAQLGSFGILAVMTVLVVRGLHDRGLWSLTGPPSLALSDFLAVVPAIALLFLAIEVLPPWFEDETEMRNLGLWLILLGPGLLALLIQTGAEELLYRGYLQQQIAVRFDHPFAWLVIPNVLFALAHADNGATGTESLQYVIWAFAFGLAASDLTARTGSLGAAIGMHLANNAYAFLLWGEEGGADSGLALLLWPADLVPAPPAPPGPVLDAVFMTDLAVVGLMWLAARVALRR